MLFQLEENRCSFKSIVDPHENVLNLYMKLLYAARTVHARKNLKIYILYCFKTFIVQYYLLCMEV